MDRTPGFPPLPARRASPPPGESSLAQVTNKVIAKGGMTYVTEYFWREFV